MIKSVNQEAVVAEILECFQGYNRALDEGNVAALNGFFWNSASTVRFGPGETLFGYDEISAFRSGRWKAGQGPRTIEKVAVTALGEDVVTTNALIRGSDGRLSRQSQTWARFPEGWRIAAAHVSPSPE